MNAKRLLAHYERIADAPDAIARLRRFILDLAVRGKLVPQDPNDEPASELLKRIAKEKARLVKAGEIKKAEAVADLTASIHDFPAPLGWAITNLQSICNSVTDGDHLPPPKAETGIPFLVIGNVRSQRIEFEGSRFVPQSYYDALDPIRRPKSGDLLYTLVGSYGIPVIVRDDQPFCVQRHIGVLRPSALVDVKFLARAMESRFAFDQATVYATGIAQKTVPLSSLRKLLLPLPPLAEQHRIVAKVDELMGLCDRLETARASREGVRDRLAAASLARLNAPDPETFHADARFALAALPALTARPDQIKQLRQTILNLAARGKLVPQDAKDEPASELLMRIAKDRTGPQAIKKARRNGETEISSLRADTPLATGWRWTNIDDIGLSMRYGTSTKCEYAAPGVPVLRIPNVSDGVVSLDDIKFGPLTQSEIRDLALSAGDLLMIRSNGSLDIVGRSAVVTAEAEGMAFAGYLVRLRLSLANIKPEYIWLALNSTDVRDQIERPIRSAVGLKNVNLTEFGALTFPLPPLAEQLRIAAKVDALMALCDRLEASLTATSATHRRLLDALLAEALAPANAREMKAAE